jgi:hypothetical protein
MKSLVSTALNAAAASSVFSLGPGLDNVRSTTHTRSNGKGIGWAIVGASPAFHTSIQVFDVGQTVHHMEDIMRADHPACSTPHTSLGVQS